MSADFRIDIQRAEQVLNKLGESTERMQQARTRLNKVGPKTLGTDGLDDACDTFQSEWEDGIKRIEDASKDIKDRLKTTIDAYKAGDEANAKSFGKG
ncbi:WXG100 family type VII secretion target [Streptomyces winkii]|uniref:WXG100 family type VII secretion target n=1 Tax=Streptomyces winkii TaxID=3051178 RepID=UPI0028D725E8|nr:type VII secretion target [Streptomyces sp. DSM 40971]